MTYLYIKNVSSSNIEVKDYFVHSIDSENVEKVIVKNINEEKFNAFQYTQNKNIENTARLYLGTMQFNRKVWEITLTDPDYSVFTGTLSVILKGGFYTNSSHTSIERADYNGDLSFVNGVGTVDVGLFGMSNYGSFIEEHNVPFNTLFYYVIDSTHTTWTDDLSAWGYSLIPSVILPMVTILGTLYNTWGNLSASGVHTLRTTSSASGPTLDYDNSLTYAVWYYLPSGGGSYGDPSKVVIVNDGGKVAATATEWVSAYYIGVYTCNSLNATIVTVYDSSNVAYNAFKFITNGTDYYYVLDGIQTDWTDDLSSIGYHPILEAYLGSGNIQVQWQTWRSLYTNSQGTTGVRYDSVKTYTFVAAYKSDGTKVDLSAHMSQIIIGRPSDSYSSLFIIDNYSGFTAYMIQYTAT